MTFKFSASGGVDFWLVHPDNAGFFGVSSLPGLVGWGFAG